MAISFRSRPQDKFGLPRDQAQKRMLDEPRRAHKIKMIFSNRKT